MLICHTSSQIERDVAVVSKFCITIDWTWPNIAGKRQFCNPTSQESRRCLLIGQSTGRGSLLCRSRQRHEPIAVVLVNICRRMWIGWCIPLIFERDSSIFRELMMKWLNEWSRRLSNGWIWIVDGRCCIGVHVFHDDGPGARVELAGNAFTLARWAVERNPISHRSVLDQ